MNTISNRVDYSNYFSKCVDELDVAKNTKLEYCWVTFYNLLVDDRKSLKNYAGNADLIEAFENSDYSKKFPIYEAEMGRKMRKGRKRRKLFDESSVLLSDCLPITNPSHLIVRDILDCLGTKELAKFCKGD